MRAGIGRADLSALAGADPAARLDAWRDTYRLGVQGDIRWTIRSGDGERSVTLERPAAWRASNRAEWARRHLGMLVQLVVFTGCALALLVLRSNDLTAALSILALALSAVGGAGPLLGVENRIPLGAGHVLTIFAWLASPLAFPIIALAILYFPSRSPRLVRYPALHAVPFLAAAPMIGLGLMTGLYLTGVDAARDLAVWDASHPGVYYGSFAAALAINVAALAEGVLRYRFNHDRNERRRIRMAVYTAVPGILAYALKEGVPIVANLAGLGPLVYPTPAVIVLQALVLMPAFGLVYAVGVERVLGPRVVLRRSLQYALASRTLTAVAILPGARARAVARIRSRDEGAGRCHERLRRADSGVGGGVPVPQPRAAVARPAVLPRRVRRAEDPALARQPRQVRDRPGGPGRRSSSPRSTKRCTPRRPPSW